MMKMMLMLIMYDGKNWRKLEQDVKWKENIYCKKIFRTKRNGWTIFHSLRKNSNFNVFLFSTKKLMFFKIT